MLKKIDKYFEEVILVFLLICITMILGLQVVSRYIFRNSLTWSEELVRYMFICSAFVGIPYCIKKQISIKVDLFKNMLPLNVQKFLFYIEHFILFVLFLIIAIFSYDIVVSSYISSQTSPAMSIPIWIIQSFVFFSCILSLIRIIQCVYYQYNKNTNKSN